ncbi:MAG: hypothetical protein CXZ00_13180 [Acidobacteria bacterium]|nr:MAG: hypothetical protein CXZ00_13180 [Acidobacteriota bacterium]
MVLILLAAGRLLGQCGVPESESASAQASEAVAISCTNSLAGSGARLPVSTANVPRSLPPPPDASRIALGDRAPLPTFISVPSTTATANANKFQWKQAIVQSVGMTLALQTWRVAMDPGIRYQIAHKPFFHDWFVSYTDYHMDRWSDGDNFIVNDVGHPLGGAAHGRIFLQNDPKSRAPISLHNGYWKSRLRALAWMTFWSTQFEVGPLSETAIGNQGGYTYVPGCGTRSSCLHPKYPNTTNNTGWTDFIITPVAGLGWILAEDMIDRYIVTPVARNHSIVGGRILRTAFEPSRSFAALFAGKFPWMLPAPENNYFVARRQKPTKVEEDDNSSFFRGEFGLQYTHVNLPVLTSKCAKGCRESLSGVGFIAGYNFTRSIGFDSSVTFLPNQKGSASMLQGQFGVKAGKRWERVGLFAKLRPGFIYYEHAWPGWGSSKPADLTRFACDLGGIVEIYAHRKGTIRMDAGATLVRYLSDHPDPHMSQIGSLLSPQYYVNQGNFQLSTSYVFRF